jgi:hypothetical protein
MFFLILSKHEKGKKAESEQSYHDIIFRFKYDYHKMRSISLLQNFSEKKE